MTAKSDIYSLGLVIAECLSGRPIDMGGSQFEVLEKRRTVPDLAAIDARLRPLIGKMLQPDPRDRPELLAAVAAWRPLTSLTGEKPNGNYVFAQKWVIGALAVLLLLVSAGRARLLLRWTTVEAAWRRRATCACPQSGCRH